MPARLAAWGTAGRPRAVSTADRAHGGRSAPAGRSASKARVSRSVGSSVTSRQAGEPMAPACASVHLAAHADALERAMYSRVAAAVRRFDERFGWGWLGACLSVAIITAAAFVLYHNLRGINFHDVLEAIAATELRDVAIAAGFVAAAYFTLTFYDLFALRTIGRKDVPYRVAALAAFSSYAIGHNVGASVFTGGAVRYRIYSAWGIDAIEVAKICFIAGLTFWLGNITVLGFGFFYHPQAASHIDQLPLWLNRTLGLFALAILTGYVAWVWRTPRVIGRQNWKVRLPSGPSTLLQIVIGIVDLSCCALAM